MSGMKIKWLGHSCFLITSDSGTRIITDPYPSGLLAKSMGIRYPKIREKADIVTISHNHLDHNNAAGVPGNPTVIRHSGTSQVNGITFEGMRGSHGRFRGPNMIYSFTVDGVKVCHLGDLVRLLTQRQLRKLGQVDVLFLPLIGIPLIGKVTSNAAKPDRVCEQLKPKVIIPMHFRNSKCWMPFPSVDRFLNNTNREPYPYRKPKTCEVEYSTDTLPTETEIVVLKPARYLT